MNVRTKATEPSAPDQLRADAAAVFTSLASDAHALDELLADAMERARDDADGATSALLAAVGAAVQRMGYTCDRALRQLGVPGLRTDLDSWMVPGYTLECLQRMGDTGTSARPPAAEGGGHG